MNTITLLGTNYLRPNRTIESILLSNKKAKKLVFVYNYEGVHFRVFESIFDAYKSESGDTNIKLVAEFTQEKDLDNFLGKTL
ncbi:hypothetical protein KJ761_02700 [Patescibacteria group bacterium]|nr:hypothetical protein [Patescibacteria group bacterium]